MEILSQYSNDNLQLIQDNQSTYSISDFNVNSDIIKLSVFSDAGSFLLSDDLIINTDFFIKNNQLFLKPNEYLDREGFAEGNYNLQFDFINRLPRESDQNYFYIAEISPSRKEIRLKRNPPGSQGISEPQQSIIIDKLNEGQLSYNFNSFIELGSGRLVPINNYTFDSVTDGVDKISLILKLNEPLPSDIDVLNTNFDIVNKFLSSQIETIFFIDREELAISGLGLDIDTGYSTGQTAIIENYENYNSITGSYGSNIINQLNRLKKDINLNVDYSKFSNHVFFGSAKSKLQNFKTKAVKLEGLFSKISSSLSFSGSKRVIEKRKDLFKQVKEVEDEFTHYEHFLYNDGQNYSSASAPGIGKNYAGTNFNNNAKNVTLTELHNHDGFDTVYKKTSTSNYLHLFTDLYNVEAPPFFSTNDFVYLSFILKGHKVDATATGLSMSLAGGAANLNYDLIYNNYNYLNFRRVPYEAFSGSAVLNPVSTGSIYKRYIFKAQQNYWRPSNSVPILGDIFFQSTFDDTEWSGSNGTRYEILTGSNIRNASTSGSDGDGFAYGIKDSTGQHKPMFFPDYKNEEGSNIPGFVTASVLPQGDLFSLFVNDTNSNEASFTGVTVSYNDPTDIHPFSKIYRQPSGSYTGASKWNSWYDGLITSASEYDNDNIHSLVNNLPLFLRTNKDHQTLRDFVNMLGEQFDLLRNYIDNYNNFYKLGYKNPSSMPDNLLPLFGNTVGFDLFNPYSGSISSYLENTEADGIGIKSAISSLWKKILNNIVYVYKTKGTKESLETLLNLYGYDAESFKLNEFGGSTEDHNPTIIDNTASELLDGLGKTTGNVSFISENQSFPMLNVSSGSDYLALDWWSNDAKPNGIEFVFHANKSKKAQTLLRSSGSNDLWDLRVVPSGSSNTKGKIEFRLNYKKNGGGAIASNHISMSTDFIDNLMSDNIFNVMLQRNVVTASNALSDCNFTQSYHMFVARKDDDKIRNVQSVTMNSHGSTTGKINSTGSFSNQNFITASSMNSTGKNLLMGEDLSGSVAEVRAWSNYVSMSKFKQHVLNYNSVVGGSATSGVTDVIYRFRLNENIVNWNTHPSSASLKIIDFNPQKVKDYSHLISTQPSLNFRSFLTEQKFYKFGVKGSDEIKNDNQTNLGAKLNVIGSLSPDSRTLTTPYNPSLNRQQSNKFGTDISYVSQIDSMIINIMSDFKLDDYLDDGGSGSYGDLINLRKQLISDNVIEVDIVSNLRAAENAITDDFMRTIQEVTPARTKADFSYNIKNDLLFRSRIKRAKLQTQLNPNKGIGNLSGSFLEPSMSSTVNENFKKDTIYILASSSLAVTSTVNENFKRGNISILSSSLLRVTSTANLNFKTSVSVKPIDLSNSKKEPVYSATPNNWTNLLLGYKNEFFKNHGTGTNQTFFYSSNPGSDGNYNTYKYESRFTFPTIGDTEEFYPVSGTADQRTGQRHPFHHHDNFRHFYNRQFIDSGSGYTYKSFFGVGAGNTGNAPKEGRMIGRTRFFSSSNGEIFYPSNHFITARTSKDVLDNLIYKGTQYDGSNATQFNPTDDPQRAVPAYQLLVGGSDTLTTLQVVQG